MEKNEEISTIPILHPINEKVQQLLEQRKKELATGIANSAESVRKKLSELKTIVEQYQLIYANLEEEAKIIREIKGIKPRVLQTA
jgi:hypothetical protein